MTRLFFTVRLSNHSSLLLLGSEHFVPILVPRNTNTITDNPQLCEQLVVAQNAIVARDLCPPDQRCNTLYLCAGRTQQPHTPFVINVQLTNIKFSSK
jgi:hypothetical protein